MTTNYDPIARNYQKSKLQPWRESIESFSLLGLLGSLAGQNVIDLACGEGYYTRLMPQLGAMKVLGVDLSRGMIDLARDQETHHPLGIEYRVGDIKSLELDCQFDLAVSAYLLNYAQSAQELQAMCRGIARLLKPGGRFVTVNASPWIYGPTVPSYRKYGFELKANEPWVNGTPIRWVFYQGDESFEIENYYLEPLVHETAFSEAGFRDFCWHKPSLEKKADLKNGFWDIFKENSPIVLMEAWKSSTV